MAKTLTITDDDLGATASVRIEDEDGQPVVRSLHFEAAPGFGLSSAALQLMEELGLRLPTQAPHVAPARRRGPAKKAAPQKRAPARKRAAGNAAGAGDGGPPAPAAAAVAGLGEPAALPGLPAGPAPQQRRANRTGPPPGPDELREAFRRHHGGLNPMAEEYGCSVSTVSNWLRKAREGGAVINLAGLDPEPAEASS